MHSSPRLLFSLSLAVVTLAALRPSPADDLDLTLRHRVETAEGSGRYHAITSPSPGSRSRPPLSFATCGTCITA